jgi:hypothetical protein
MWKVIFAANWMRLSMMGSNIRAPSKLCIAYIL